MVKKIVVVLLMITLLSSFVVAQEYTSKIRVKTLPYHDVFLSIVNPLVDAGVFVILKAKSNMYGDADFLYTTEESGKLNFYLRVKVKEGDLTYRDELFDEKLYVAGEDYFLEVVNDGDEIVPTPGIDNVVEDATVEDVIINETEDTVNETEEMVEIDDMKNESVNWLTGRSVADVVKGPAVYGGVGAIFILGILALFIVSRRRKLKISASSLSRKGNSQSVSEKLGGGDGELSKAEARLKAVQAEIQRLKNQDKVAEVRKRIAAEEEELRRLRGGRI